MTSLYIDCFNLFQVNFLYILYYFMITVNLQALQMVLIYFFPLQASPAPNLKAKPILNSSALSSVLKLISSLKFIHSFSWILQPNHYVQFNYILLIRLNILSPYPALVAQPFPLGFSCIPSISTYFATPFSTY